MSRYGSARPPHTHHTHTHSHTTRASIASLLCAPVSATAHRRISFGVPSVCRRRRGRVLGRVIVCQPATSVSHHKTYYAQCGRVRCRHRATTTVATVHPSVGGSRRRHRLSSLISPRNDVINALIVSLNQPFYCSSSSRIASGTSTVRLVATIVSTASLSFSRRHRPVRYAVSRRRRYCRRRRRDTPP